jgi:transposase
MPESRRQYSAEFKARVAIDAVRGDRSIVEIAEANGVRPNQVALWRKKLTDEVASLFTDKRLGPSKHKRNKMQVREQLYREIGELAVELGRQRMRGISQASDSDRSARRGVHFDTSTR